MDAQGWTARVAGRAGPIYLAIADALAAAVAEGELQPGDRLPTHRALADALGLDLTTVTRAYAEARRRGLLEAVVGRGSFVRGGAAPVRREGPVDLGMNLPPLPVDPPLAALLQRGIAGLLARPDGADFLTYRPGAGTAEEREAGAAWLRPVLGAVEPGRVLVCPGAQPALLAVLGAVAGPGDAVLAEAMAYPGLRSAAAQLGIRLVGVACDAEGMLPEAAEAACREVRPKAICCIPTIQNPTTATMPEGRRRALAGIARREGIALIEDDAYGLLPGEALPAVSSFVPEAGFHIATLSKVLSPALRLAFLVVPDAGWAGRIGAALRANVLMASPLLAGLLAGWIRDGTAAAVTAAIRRECVARQRIAREVLPAGSFEAHPEGLHLWLRLPPRWGRLDFAAHLRRQAGLAVVPSDAFALGAAPEAVRLSLGAAPGREALRGALQAVASALRAEAPAPFTDVV